MGFKIQILVFLFLVSFSVNGQYYSVLSEKYNLLRDAQLIDSGIFHNSLLIRPIPLVPVLKNPYYKNNYFKDFLNDSVQKGISIVPLTFGLIYNSFRPYGDNPGVFISSKGLQKRISAGLTFTSSFLNLVCNQSTFQVKIVPTITQTNLDIKLMVYINEYFWGKVCSV